jgi:ribosome-binding factor A
MARRPTQVAESIAHHAADFFARAANRASLITVTHADISPNFKNITIFLSVLPEAQESPALAFAKRERSAFRDYLKEHSALHPVPTVDFEIDIGEKNRQRVDELTRK